MNNALIFGASGQIGSDICSYFYSKGALVTGVLRKEDSVDRAFKTIIFNKNNKEFSDSLKKQLKDNKLDSIIWSQGINFNDNISDFNILKNIEMYEVNVLYILSTLKILMEENFLSCNAKLCIVSSIWQNIAKQQKLSYCITKSALQGLVQSLCIDLGKRGMLVNAVLPGALDTNMTRANLSSGQIQKLESETPLGSLPQMNDVTGLIYFLCSSNNTGITGQFIAADRGFSNVKII